MDWLGITFPASFIAFLFVFLGTLLRTIYPYLKKVKEVETQNQLRTEAKQALLPQLTFDKTYLAIFGADVLISFIATMLFFSAWSPPEGTLFHVAIAAFIAGWGLQDITNRVAT
jgi:hypothetical protein